MRFDRFKTAACAALTLTAGVLSAADGVLYWMVDDSATVDGQSISSFFDGYDAPSGSAFAARVRVTGGDIQAGEDVFLDMYIPGSGVDAGNGDLGVEFSDIGGYWGAGAPTGNQSPLGIYSAGSPEYSFIVELGNIDTSENWTTVATSASAAYSSLGDYIHQTFDLNPGRIGVWTTTTFTAVPEPSGGLLTAMGLAILSLRRKRVEEEA